ncbi:MAG: bifunctional diaminohydroxyphosphoribosylaminopyrimidine deaminase/5-amino-6-(5-phosphoribosylamino)uracil reductase RibD [Gammaproteobacteria bacterium]|nr:bifunctional diaminohydroxyphosphoribosylaminopyrimidine deaminase/5-amino-6-(5-phosphoribosylamino)uracil reductase RibD [Gammaproteobacteria bacterium]
MRSNEDHTYMARTLQLARRGVYTTDPNPRVGCIVVKDGQVLGEAWHARCGEPHAEVLALRQAGAAARGATLYVNLEPCCHQGRTPPCTDPIIDAGIARVVTAVEDPNPSVSRGGIDTLRSVGIDVDVGLMQQEAEVLNRGFLQRMRNGAPWVTLKIAASLDGRTAMASGESKWITGGAARADVQNLRAQSSAVLTGIGTIEADDPRLTVRLGSAERQPIRVVADSRLRISQSARVFSDPGAVLVAAAIEDPERAGELSRKDADVVVVPGADGKVDLPELMRELANREINELLVEAGPTLSGAMLGAGLVDELVVYMAPQLLGSDARGMVTVPGLDRLDQRLEFDIKDVRMLAHDLKIVSAPVAAGHDNK